MNARPLFITAVALAALALPASTARAGGSLPAVALDDFGQTKAKSLDDFAGRAVLIEFFAYW
jgi:hypothetical protein